MSYYYQDGINVQRNQVTIAREGGINYNATIRHTATPVDSPIIEPVTLLEQKKYSHVDLNDDDQKILGLITQARELIEQHIGRYLIPVTITATIINAQGHIRLIGSPANNILEGTTPVDLSKPFGEKEVTYDGGYAAADVPQGLKLAILQTVDFWLNGGRGLADDVTRSIKPYSI